MAYIIIQILIMLSYISFAVVLYLIATGKNLNKHPLFGVSFITNNLFYFGVYTLLVAFSYGGLKNLLYFIPDEYILFTASIPAYVIAWILLQVLVIKPHKAQIYRVENNKSTKEIYNNVVMGSLFLIFWVAVTFTNIIGNYF